MVASMLRAQRHDPAKAHAKCAFATNYALANLQLRSPLILRYRMQRDKPSLPITSPRVCLSPMPVSNQSSDRPSEVMACPRLVVQRLS